MVFRCSVFQNTELTYFSGSLVLLPGEKIFIHKGDIQQRGSQNHILVTIIQVAILRNQQKDKLSNNFYNIIRCYYLLYNILYVSYIHLLSGTDVSSDTSFYSKFIIMGNKHLLHVLLFSYFPLFIYTALC